MATRTFLSGLSLEVNYLTTHWRPKLMRTKGTLAEWHWTSVGILETPRSGNDRPDSHVYSLVTKSSQAVVILSGAK